MASGIKICEDVKLVYQQIHMTSQKTIKLRYAIFCFDPSCKQVCVEKKGTAEEGTDYDTVISSLPTDDVRYVCYDFEYINKDGCRKSDVILISWHPDGSSIRKKMICASSFNALKAALSHGKNVLEGDTYSEVDSKAALEKVGGKAIPT